MARKAIVDKDIILNMLREGETTQHIALRFNVSRQAIDLHRKDFIARGLLPDKRASRSKNRNDNSPVNTKESEKPLSSRQPELLSEPSRYSPESLSLDTHIDLLISAFSALKRLPAVEREIELYKLEYEKVKRELERMKSRERKRLDQENRWMLIQNEDISSTNPETDS